MEQHDTTQNMESPAHAGTGDAAGSPASATDSGAGAGAHATATVCDATEDREADPQPAIDLVQVLAANQTLLKNLYRKIDSLENKVVRLEVQIEMQRMRHQQEIKTRLLLEAPPVPVIPWQPDAATNAKDASLLQAKKGGWFDSFFRPWKLRHNRESPLDH